MTTRMFSEGNEGLKNILKNFILDMKSVPEFDQYYPDSRPRFILKEKQNRAEKHKKALRNLIAECDNEKQKRFNGISRLKNGSLKKEDYSSGTLRTQALTEYNSAVLIANSKPENVDVIIKNAVDQKRNEFVFTLIDLLSGQKLNNSESYKLNEALKYAKDKFGIDALEKEYKKYSDFADETLGHLHLLESDLEGFERRASVETKVDELWTERETINDNQIKE